jgi:hypothetical protein
MTKTLLQGVVRGTDTPIPPDADAYNPVVSLKRRTMRTLHRDLAKMGVEPDLANDIARMVMASLNLALDTPDISLEDRTAVCLMAERVMAATVVAIAQHGATPELAQTAND